MTQLLTTNSSGTGGSERSISFDDIYPIGSIYISVSTDLPPIFTEGGRSWEKIESGLCLWSANEGQLGEKIPAGLPGLPAIKFSTNSFSGLDGNSAVKGWTGSSVGKPTTVPCSVARHSIYGNSDTVQPPALGVTMWKRVS